MCKGHKWSAQPFSLTITHYTIKLSSSQETKQEPYSLAHFKIMVSVRGNHASPSRAPPEGKRGGISGGSNLD